MDLQIEQFKSTFFQECHDLLDGLESQLTALKSRNNDPELLNAAFRAVHSIKGGAGMFGFSRLVDFAHNFENALRLMRSGSIAITDDVVDAAIQACDVIADLVDAAREGIEPPATFELDAVERLATSVCIEVETAAVNPKYNEQPTAGTGHAGCYRYSYLIDFKPKPQLLQRLSEPLLIFRHLELLGELTIEADVSALPAFAELAPTASYLSWCIKLSTDSVRPAIEEAFEFVMDDCDLVITCTEDRGPQTEGISGNTDEAVVVPAPDVRSGPVVSNAAATANRPMIGSSIRVDLDRIDRLVDMVGEIAVSQTMVFQHIDQSLITANPRLVNELSQLLKLTQSLQDSVMAIRAQPVRVIFSRMTRVVRDLMSETGKDVELEICGAETEIDKALIEKLSDPLIHMIRNAVDHGIESPDERAAAGKAPRGRIRIGASQRGNQILIEVSDDGRGIHRDKLRRKAIEAKIISADAVLTDDETTDLMFLPGVSTAVAVTNISGRGVGMDIVKKSVQNLGGRISVTSVPGQGCKMTLNLPLTLAVADGMIVRFGDESYVIPVANIVECLAIGEGQINCIPGFGDVLNVRGTHIKVVDLAAVLMRTGGKPALRQMAILVEVDSGALAALLVDEIVGQQQVVMKSIRENLDQIAGISGATILGSGEIALFLDVAAIAEIAKQLDPMREGFGSTNRSTGKLAA